MTKSSVVFVFGLSVIATLLASRTQAEDLPRCVDGIYPHLAMFNDEGECGTGAVVPWAGSLWAVTYGPHCPVGSSDKLYQISPDLRQTIRPESVGGTPADRLVHRETNQLLIGPYVIDAKGGVRVVPPAKMPGRLTGAARHLVDPSNLVYVATMDNGLYALDMRTLAVKTLQRDHNGVDGKIWGQKRDPDFPLTPDWDKAVDNVLPGSHTKGMCTGFGRIQLANNGEYHPEAKTNPWIPAGVLGDCAPDGTNQRIIRRCQFTDVTTADGIYGNEHPKENPVWALGWDAKSVLLAVTTNGTAWTYYRLPKGSHCYDGAHGWNTEWPRIREAGLGGGNLLATMHGTFWRFPRGFSPAAPNGIRPLSTYLKVIGDFCWWADAPDGGSIVFGCDDQAKNEFLGSRTLKKDAPKRDRSQSNLWFVKPADLSTFGPPSGEGWVWNREDVKAGAVSDPFLWEGYAHREFSFTDRNGRPVRHELLHDGDWVRVKALEDVRGANAHFLYGPERPATLPAVRGMIEVYDDYSKKTYRFPNVNGDTTVICREVATERDLLYVGGVFYELPADNAGGFAELRPIALADEPVRTIESRLGLVFINGKPMALDRLWKNGTASSAYWLWRRYVRRDAPSAWRIELGDDHPALTNAAVELQRVLRLATGEKLSIGAGKGPRIRLSVDSGLGDAETMRIRTVSDGVDLLGGAPRSTLRAAYLFLQRKLGVRWYWAGEDGEFIPECERLDFGSFDETVTPSIRYRGIHMTGDWYKIQEFNTWMSRNFVNLHRHGCGGFPDEARGFYRMWSAHTLHLNAGNKDERKGRDELMAAHPDWYAERGGKRWPSQACLSSEGAYEEMLRRFAARLDKMPGLEFCSFLMGDNQNYCQCEKCRTKSVSDLYFTLCNRLAKDLRPRYPKLGFVPCAYQGYGEVPSIPIEDMAFVEVATHDRCNVHRYGSSCQKSQRIAALLDRWTKAGVPLGQFTYEFDIYPMKGGAVPFFSLVAENVRRARDRGFVSLFPEIDVNGPEGMGDQMRNRFALYLYAQLMFDADLDWKQVLREWCDRVYGPAADALYGYYVLLDEKWDALDHHEEILVSPALAANALFTSDVRAKCEAFLAAAEKAVKAAPTGRAAREVALERRWYGEWCKYLKKDVSASAKKMVWFNGFGDKDRNGTRSTELHLAENGWKLCPVTNAAEFAAIEKPTAIWLRQPQNDKLSLKKETWPVIRQAVKDGATLVVSGYWSYDVAGLLDDTSYAAEVRSFGETLDLQRHTTRLAEGEWVTKPYDLTTAFKRTLTPCYCPVPKEPSLWKPLAWMPRNSKHLDEEVPYLFVRPYGKGQVVLAGYAFGISACKLVENLRAREK